MHPRLLPVILSCALLTAACGTDDEIKFAPEPLHGPVIELRLTQVGRTHPSGALVGTNMLGPFGPTAGAVPALTGKGYWKGELQEGTQRLNLGRISNSSYPCLLLYYANGGIVGAQPPAAGEYIEGEIFADGVSKGVVRLDRQTYDLAFPCSRFTDGRGTHLYKLVQVLSK
jgi:hypothetical protein